MLNLPILRWGKPYTSLLQDEVVHFLTGESLARVSLANTGLFGVDMKAADKAREILTEIPTKELIETLGKAADLYLEAALPVGDGEQSPSDFVKLQSASTGLPEHMCRSNMEKNHFVLSHMEEILDALSRGLPAEVLTRGFGVEDRGVLLSYQAETPVLGLVLPSNSPGVHTLWLPVIPLQIGLVLKPGPQEPWTPYRIAAAFTEAGIPAETISIYPGGPDIGAEVVRRCDRSLIFGGTETVQRYKGDPRVQVHGPGFSKILIGEDEVDNWESHIDLIAESVYLNGGRSCINCSGVWAPRHTNKIAKALAERLGPVTPTDPADPEAGLAAFTVPGAAAAISGQIDSGLRESGVNDATQSFGARLVSMERCGYLRPTVIHCESPAPLLANTEYMFPFVSVVRCPQEEMLREIGSTLVCSAITKDEGFRKQLLASRQIDRLNLGAIPTTKLDWLQPHEGNIIDFLFRPRALQFAESEAVLTS